MNDYRPVACSLYDHLEIACLYHYRLRIELVGGENLEAEAVGTETDAQKQEFLLVHGANGPRRLRLDELLAITPLDPRARFGRVELAPRC